LTGRIAVPDRSTESLFLQVDASVELLRRRLAEGEQPLSRFEQRAAGMAANVDRSLSEMGKRFPQLSRLADDASSKIERSFNDSFQRIQQAAETAIKLPQVSGGGLNLGAAEARAAADSARQQAIAVGLIEQAAQRAAAGEGVLTAETRAYLQAAGAARIESERRAAELLKEAGALERLEVELQQAGAAQQVFGTRSKAIVETSGANRFALQNLGFQLQDVAVQYAGGTNAARIFAQQGPQIVGAVQMMSGSTSRFAAFMGGPWGVAIGVGVGVLGALIQKLTETDGKMKDVKDAAKEAATALTDFYKNIGGANQISNIASEQIRLMAEAQAQAAQASAEIARIESSQDKSQNYRLMVLRQQRAEAQGRADAAKAELAAIQKMGEAQQRQERNRDRLSTKPTSGSSGGTASVGDMVALVEKLFPGARITSTTGGKHTAHSDHYAGRAIDFVPAGGMGSISKAEVLERLQEAGVDIRRNAQGVRQFFGPGDPGHSDHFHVAWEGSPSPESASRTAESMRHRAEEAAQKVRHSAEAYEAQILQGTQERANILRDGVIDAQQLAELQKDEIDAELDRKLAANKKLQLDNKWTDAQRIALDAQDVANARLKRANVDAKAAQAVLSHQYDLQQDDLDTQIALLRIRESMATTDAERRKVSADLLALEQEQRRKALERTRDTSNDPAEVQRALRALQALPAQETAERAQNRDEHLTPLEEYRKRLHAATDDMSSALERVKVDGLESLEDGLLGLITGTETVAGAFKKMAASILADLARIAIEKAILKIFHFSVGGEVPQKRAGGGIIFGPGGEREDRVPVLASPGEFFINAASTRKYRPLIEAINSDRLPRFASGGLVAPNVAALTRAASRGASAVAVNMPINIDARGAGPREVDQLRLELASLKSGLPGQIVSTVADARERRILRDGY
jgi:hypothetical protein